MSGRKRGTSGPDHHFGGDWTSVKLEILRHYLQGYTTALKNKRFRIAYIDAFAGTGYRSRKEIEVDSLLFPDLSDAAPQALLDGSARIALHTEPQFDRYIFIERDPRRCEELERLKIEFPDQASRIRVENADANTVVQELCARNWTSRRAVLFLDPYGMQVDWATIEAIAKTGAIDLWLLIPLGIGINRLLPRDGEIPQEWRRALDRFFGTPDWFGAFYDSVLEPTLPLFDGDANFATKHMKRDVAVIGKYCIERLKSIFPGVSEHPRVLSNSTNCPLYILCFAVSSSNPVAQKIALRIANHILTRI